MADANIFQQFLNKVGRGYGQLDKNVFGGLLPGGAATPIGAAFQGAPPPPKGVRTLSSTERRVASLVDAAAGAVAGAQPFIQKTIQSTPEPVQGAIASGLNALPFSVNLFSRYYTGLGNKNLEVPQSITAGIGNALNMMNTRRPQMIKEYQSQIDNTSQMLNAARSGNLPSLPNRFTPSVQNLNDSLAELKSNLNRVQQGDIPFNTYFSNDNNPLTSPSTSIGMVWVSPKDQGYQAKEKYDFVYGDADRYQSGPVPGGVLLSPSQQMAVQAATTPPGIMKNSPTVNPLTFLGRSIVSKLPDKSFDYLINIP